MKISYCSDIHLECINKNQIPNIIGETDAETLILAGDICSCVDNEDYTKFIKFLQYYTPKYKYIVHVGGNHLYYTNKDIKKIKKEDTMLCIKKKLRDLNIQFPNYYFLDCETIVLDNINFIGCTMWTKINIKDMPTVQCFMTDYRKIYTMYNDEIVKLHVVDTDALHKKHVKFIKDAIEKAKESGLRSILITHHVPIEQRNVRKSDKLTQAFQTDITGIIQEPIEYVIFGHSHERCDTIINGIRYLSNPMGYPGEKTKYIKDKYFVI